MIKNRDDWGITVIGANAKIAENAVITSKSMIDGDAEVAINEK